MDEAFDIGTTVCRFQSASYNFKLNKPNIKEHLLMLIRKDENNEWLWRSFGWEQPEGGRRDYGPYDSFEAFLKEWSSATVDDFQLLFADDGEVLDRLAKVSLAELSKRIPEGKEQGAPEGNKNAEKNKGDIPESIPFVPKPKRLGGTSNIARIARLKRDHPDVARRLEAGEFKTVADAERAAGTRAEKRPAFRLVLPTDNAEEAMQKVNEWFIATYSKELSEFFLHQYRPCQTDDNIEEARRQLQ